MPEVLEYPVMKYYRQAENRSRMEMAIYIANKITRQPETHKIFVTARVAKQSQVFTGQHYMLKY